MKPFHSPIVTRERCDVALCPYQTQHPVACCIAPLVRHGVIATVAICTFDVNFDKRSSLTVTIGRELLTVAVDAGISAVKLKLNEHVIYHILCRRLEHKRWPLIGVWCTRAARRRWHTASNACKSTTWQNTHLMSAPVVVEDVEAVPR